MRRFYYLALVALMGIALSSCSLIGGGGNEPSFQLSDLQGLWLEKGTEHYVRFTTEQSDEPKYLYGREWDEAEDIYEDQLKPYGNGWFKYWFESNGGLHELHLMDNEGAEIPKEYIVSKLTDTALEYYEKDKKSNKFYFDRVVVKPN